MLKYNADTYFKNLGHFIFILYLSWSPGVDLIPNLKDNMKNYIKNTIFL